MELNSLISVKKDALQKLYRLNLIKDIVYIIAGVCMASIGLKGFLLPNGFLDGGAMGISLLISRFTGLELSLLIVLVNLPFILLGLKIISKEFSIKSTIAILLLSVLVHYIQLPLITGDKLLVSIFGGFFLGAGIGLSIRGGAVIDGTEVLALKVSRESSLTVGDFIAIFNIVLFGFAAIFINVETAMYAMLTYLAASKTVDFLIHGIEQYIGVTIVSSNAVAIKNDVMNELGLGMTVYNATSGYGKSGAVEDEHKILFCVVTRLEVSKLLLIVKSKDEKAFIVQHAIMDAMGGIVKRRPLH